MLGEREMRQDLQSSVTVSSLHCLDEKAWSTLGAHLGEGAVSLAE